MLHGYSSAISKKEAKFFIKADSICESVSYECFEKNERKQICKKKAHNEEEIVQKILSMLLSFASATAFIDKKAHMLARNCVKKNQRFKALGFLDNEGLDRFMRENFAPLFEKKPSDVEWKRFLLDAAVVFKN